MSRRNLLGGIAALAAAPVSTVGMVVPPADAEVIRLAQAVVDAEEAVQVAYAGPTLTWEEEKAYEPEREHLIHVLADQVEILAPLPVITLAGAMAKARAALAIADKDPADGEIIARDYVAQLAYAALEDLVRVAGGEA